MEDEETFKINEIRKYEKKGNKSLLTESFYLFVATAAAGCGCIHLNTLIDKGDLICIPFSLIMFYWYVEFLKYSRKHRNIVYESIQKEVDLVDALENENLKK